jgi:hypothetical protein
MEHAVRLRWGTDSQGKDVQASKRRGGQASQERKRVRMKTALDKGSRCVDTDMS